MRNDGVHFLIAQIEFEPVFSGPASGAVQIACAGGVKKDGPGYIGIQFFSPFLTEPLFCKRCLITDVEKMLHKNMAIDFMVNALCVLRPLLIFILDDFNGIVKPMGPECAEFISVFQNLGYLAARIIFHA